MPVALHLAPFVPMVRDGEWLGYGLGLGLGCNTFIISLSLSCISCNAMRSFCCKLSFSACGEARKKLQWCKRQTDKSQTKIKTCSLETRAALEVLCLASLFSARTTSLSACSSATFQASVDISTPRCCYKCEGVGLVLILVAN